MIRPSFYLVFAAFLFLFSLAKAQQTGANCNNALIINALPYSDPNTAAFPPDAVSPSTCAAGNNFDALTTCVNLRSSAWDFFYSYTPAADICIDIQVTTDNVDSIPASIFVIANCPGAPNASCIAQKTVQDPNNSNGLEPPYVTTLQNVFLDAGRTYYIIISGNELATRPVGASTCFVFDTRITQSATCGEIPGNGCENAEIIPAVPYEFKDASTCGNDDYLTFGNNNGGTYAPDHIYKYTPATDFCGIFRLETDAPKNYMVLYNACPTLVRNSQIARGSSAKPIIHRFMAGTTYYLLVSHDTNGTGQPCFGYDLSLDLMSDSGKNCSVALPIPSLPFTQYNTTSCKDDDFDNVGGCNLPEQMGNEIVYTYDSPGNECIAVQLKDYYNRLGLYVFDRCPELPGAICLASITDADILTSNVFLDYTVGAPQRLYIVISSQAGYVDFELKVSGYSIPGSTCANPITVTSLPFAEYNSTACKHDDFDQRGTCDTLLQAGNEAVYVYDSPGNECIAINVSGMTERGGVYIFDRCPEDPAAQCLALGIGQPTLPDNLAYVSIDYTFTAAQRIYIVVSNQRNKVQLDYHIEVTTYTDLGSSCSNPIIIPNTPFSDYNSTACKKDDFDGPCPEPTVANIDANEIVYTYASPGGECLRLVVSELTSRFSALEIFDRCPSDPGAQCLFTDFRQLSREDYEIDLLLLNPQTIYIVIGSPTFDNNPSFHLQSSVSTVDISGSVCSLAIPVPSVPFSGTYVVSCKGKDLYAVNCLTNYGQGNDMVLEIPITQRQCLRFVAKTNGKGGMALMNTCQPRAATPSCLVSALCEYGCDSMVMEYTLDPGTYYLVLASYFKTLDLVMDIKIEPNGQIAGTVPCVDCDDNVCVSCEQAGVEKGRFQGNWAAYYGGYDNPKNYTGFVSGSINDPYAKHAIVSSGSYDPVVGPELPLKSPFDGQFAMRLGNRRPFAQAEVLEYSFTVDAQSPIFYYAFAVVLEDGHHGVNNPGLKIKLTNSLGVEIPCASYNVTAYEGIPGFKPVDLSRFDEYYPGLGYAPGYKFKKYWKGWTIVAVPLDNYVGEVMTASFEVRDCFALGHYAYCYLDARCGNSDFARSTKYLCEGATTTLTAPLGYKTYDWSTGDHTSSITVATPGTYTCRVTTVADCSVDLQVEVLPAPNPLPAISFQQLCDGSTFNFFDQSTFKAGDTSHVARVEWDFGDGQVDRNGIGSTHVYSDTGTYILQAKVVSTNECSATVDTVLKYNPVGGPLTVIAADSLRVCEGETIQLSALDQFGVTYTWSGPNAYSASVREPSLPNATPAKSGYYKVAFQVPTCPVVLDSIYAEVITVPQLKAISDTAICQENAGVLLSASVLFGSAAYRWYTKAGALLATTATYQSPVLTDSTSFFVKANRYQCESALKEVRAAVKPKPVKPSVQSVRLCEGGDTLLNAAAAGTLSWFDQAVNGTKLKDGNSLSITSIQQDTAFYVEQSSLGCRSDRASLAVYVKPKPPAIADQSHSICEGNKIDLTAGTNSQEVYWLDKNGVLLKKGTSYTSPVLNKSTHYHVTSHLEGCVGDTALVAVIVADRPSSPITAGVKVCRGADTLLKASSGSVLTWYSSGGSQYPPLATGSELLIKDVQFSHTYYVRAGTNDCFSDFVAANVQLLEIPSEPEPHGRRTLCEGEDLVIDITTVSQGKYQWKGPNNYSSTQKGVVINNANVIHSGIYSVRLRDEQCFSEWVEVPIEVKSAQLAVLTYPKNIYCEQIKLLQPTLLGSSSGTYVSTPSGLALNDLSGTLDLSLSEVGQYEVIYMPTGDCSRADTFPIQIIAKPNANFAYTPEICRNAMAEWPVLPPGGELGTWSSRPTGLRLDKNTGKIDPQFSVPGMYIIVHTVTSTADCPLAIDSTALSILEQPSRPSGVSDRVVCEGETLQLTAFAPNGWSVQWQDPKGVSVQGPSFLLKNAKPIVDEGYYELWYLNASCAGPKDSVRLQVEPLPIVKFQLAGLPSDALVQGQQIQFLNQSSLSLSYNWNFGDGGTSVDVEPIYQYIDSGNYRVRLEATTALGCRNSYEEILHIGQGDQQAEVYLPQIFSPNADLKNDVFEPINHTSYTNTYLDIYNRWGERVYRSVQNNPQWDGKVEGVAAPAGVYVYQFSGIGINNRKAYQRLGTVAVSY